MEQSRHPDSPANFASSSDILNSNRPTGKSLCDGKEVADGIGSDIKYEFVLSPIVEQNHDNDLLKLHEGVPKENFINRDFLDPVPINITDGEDNDGAESSNTNTTATQFFDAWEASSEVSSDGGTHISLPDIETETREMRLNLLDAIEKRKQCEEALNKMQNQWRKMAGCLLDAGLTVPPDLFMVPEEDEQSNAKVAEELLGQIYITRIVSETIGKEVGKVEMETEMESRLESKNFEIARLCDRLKYYQEMNREMSQMNQEAIEMGRRKRRRRQRWVWGIVGSGITIGAVALACSFLPTTGTYLQCQEKGNAAN